MTPCKPGAIWAFVLATEGVQGQDTLAREWLVVCLCAQWCGVCHDYQSTFEMVSASVRAQHPCVRFLWVDVEDEADMLHPVEVEDFPTLLIAAGTDPYFFGPMTPQAQTLERMVRSALADGAAPRPCAPEVHALLGRLQTWGGS